MRSFKPSVLLLISFFLILGSCIKDDILDDAVPEKIAISNPLVSLKVGTSYQFKADYFNTVGALETINLIWETSDTSVLLISETGLAQAKNYGNVTITVKTEEKSLKETLLLIVNDTTESIEIGTRTGTLKSTSSYDLEGHFELISEGANKLRLQFDDSFISDQGLPGAYVYLTNNPNTNNGAFEVGPVEIFEGKNSFEIDNDSVKLNTYEYVLFYCKPFSVKVGDGKFDN